MSSPRILKTTVRKQTVVIAYNDELIKSQFETIDRFIWDPISDLPTDLKKQLSENFKIFKQEVDKVRQEYRSINPSQLVETDKYLENFLNNTMTFLIDTQRVINIINKCSKETDQTVVPVLESDFRLSQSHMKTNLDNIENNANKLNKGYGWNQKSEEIVGGVVTTLGTITLALGVALCFTGVGIPFGILYIALGVVGILYGTSKLSLDDKVDQAARKVKKNTGILNGLFADVKSKVVEAKKPAQLVVKRSGNM